jgi:hypothetical protein
VDTGSTDAWTARRIFNPAEVVAGRRTSSGDLFRFHSQKNPLLNQKDLIEWRQHEFSLEVSKAAMSKLFKEKERFLK